MATKIYISGLLVENMGLATMLASRKMVHEIALLEAIFGRKMTNFLSLFCSAKDQNKCKSPQNPIACLTSFLSREKKKVKV